MKRCGGLREVAVKISSIIATQFFVIAAVALARDDPPPSPVRPWTAPTLQLVGLYGMISEMRVLSTTKTIESADKVARMIVNTYRSPNKTLPELEDMVNRGAIDVLQTFSEAARQEFRRLGV